jgi:hypothetical protein
MYINKIDELIDKIIDDFYNKVDFSKILTEANFVKYQAEINKILLEYIKSIDDKQIFEIVGNQQNVNTVIEIIKRYLGYYIFMTIALFYKGKLDTYINNVVEFSKNQPGFSLKIENFFNSENNGNIIKFYSFVNNILLLVDAESSKLVQLAKKPEFKEAVDFLNELGDAFISAAFKLSNKKDQAHNIIKTIILTELYFKYEKKDVYLILESAEKEKGIYTFIDIVVPRTEFIDFNSIEKALSKRDVEKGLAYDIYDIIIQFEDLSKSKDLTPDEKILVLLNNKILAPITDDFMLYHKDTEKYEKPQQQHDLKKKKEETKIRYIVNKIDRVTEYYSEETKRNPEAKSNIEKLFYTPLANRNAILINNIEDIKIINKLINQGRKTIENNEYYNDLMAYKAYPYVNFKDFKTYGFSLNMNKTIDAVRYCTFEKQIQEDTGKNKQLQLRRGSLGQTLNIVGFMIPTDQRTLYCQKAGDIVNIRDLTYKQGQKRLKYDNAYAGIMKLLKHSLFKYKNDIKYPTYWIFDLAKDKVRVETYEQIGKMTNQEHTKLTVASLYDDILQLMYEAVIKYINNKKQITVNKFYSIIKFFESRVFSIPKESDIYNRLEQVAFFEKYFKAIKRYDKNEDKFPGLVGNVIKLPIYEAAVTKKIPVLTLKYIKEQETQEKESGAETYGAICQHFLTWEKISAIRKKNPGAFGKLLFEFVMQYVVENYEDDFICKSCGTQVDVKNYVLDGTYDDDGRFVTLSVPMTVPLEDIPEYEKYKTTIRSMDKLIERLATISNIQFLLEKSARQKNPIKSRIIRDSLDMVLLHNSMMKETYKDRSERVIQKYGINKELTNFFVFELDNNIFIYSSKDKDYYKPIKRNNVLVYILLTMLLEFNESHLIYLIGDKTCNYYLFSKYGLQLFDNLKIIKNNKSLVAPLSNYKVLCYLIFYFSCLITKFNIWQYESEDKKSKKFSPIIQKTIIHTTVDLINSILEVNNSLKNNYLYTMVSVKFFQKLNTLFQNNTVLQKIKEIEDRRSLVEGEQKKVKQIKTKAIILGEHYKPADYLEVSEWFTCKIAKFFTKPYPKVFPRYYVLNNVTNCEDGNFHNWQVKGKTMECSNCKKLLSEVQPEKSDVIVENYKYILLRKLAKKYCKEGEFHNFIYNAGLKCNVCSKCKYADVNKLTPKELDELEKNIVELKEIADKKEDAREDKRLAKAQSKQTAYDKVVTSIKSAYGKTKSHKEDYYNYVDNFIDFIDSVIGKNININSENIYTKYSTYIIDHDYHGYPLPTPLIISEQDNKIVYKRDHPFFKTDVLYYTNQKLKIDVFYNAVTLLLLGSKETNKDYELPRKHNVYMKINYSIADRLKLLGHSSRYINIADKVDEIKENYKLDDPQEIIKLIVSDVSRTRIQNLKRCIAYIQRFINRIKYQYQAVVEEGAEVDDKFLDKYRSKLKSVVTRKDNDKFLSDWKAVKNNLFFSDLKGKTVNLTTDAKFLLSEDINYYDYHGNLILFYLVDELHKLLEMNSEKYIQINLTFLVIEIIIKLHKLFDTEAETTNYELKRFSYIVHSRQSVYEMDEGYSMEGEVEGFYGEYKDAADTEDVEELDKKEEAEEEAEALDIEGELDYEIDYEAGVNTE